MRKIRRTTEHLKIIIDLLITIIIDNKTQGESVLMPMLLKVEKGRDSGDSHSEIYPGLGVEVNLWLKGCFLI
jgi:hypothetical protein